MSPFVQNVNVYLGDVLYSRGEENANSRQMGVEDGGRAPSAWPWSGSCPRLKKTVQRGGPELAKSTKSPIRRAFKGQFDHPMEILAQEELKSLVRREKSCVTRYLCCPSTDYG